MTDEEKAIVMAYTGKAMLVGDKLDTFYKYIGKICGRPIWTHELSDKVVLDEIEAKSKPDFIKLCKETTEAEPIRHAHLVLRNYKTIGPIPCCSQCGWVITTFEIKYCPNCGAKMERKE